MTFKKKIEYIARLLIKYQAVIPSIKILFSWSAMLKVRLKKYPYPFYIRRKSSDPEVLNDVLLKRGYDFRTPINFEPRVIIDCGANIGLTSIFFRKKYPNAKIVAIEPEKKNYELMLKNLDKYSNIYPLNVGIWNKDTFLAVNDPDATAWGFSFHEVDEESEGCSKALSIKSIMDKYDIDYIDILKIDIEGGEKDLFQANYDYWLSRTRILIIELHDRSVEGCSKAFFDALYKYNFSTEIKGDNLFCFMR